MKKGFKVDLQVHKFDPFRKPRKMHFLRIEEVTVEGLPALKYEWKEWDGRKYVKRFRIEIIQMTFGAANGNSNVLIRITQQ